MKKRLLFLFAFSILFLTKAKCQEAKDTSEYPYWIQMMQYDTVNFFKVQKAFYEYYDAHHDEDAVQKEEKEGEEEEEGVEIFKRWEYLTRQRIKPDGTRLAPDQVFDAFKNYSAINLNRAIKGAVKVVKIPPGTNPTGNWKSIGPSAIPTDRVYQVDGIGRINAIAFHPKNKGTIYVGAPDGGLWVTTDSGSTWTTKTDSLASLGVSAIAIDPVHPDTLYIGTGDRDNADAPGIGVLKSTNNGAKWSSGTGMGSVVVSKILIDPKNTSILLAATSSGIYRSTNGGGSWSKLTSNIVFFKDIVFKPHNPNIVYATANGSFYRSVNNGVSWSQITSGLTSAYRGVIGVTAADTNRVYFITTGSTTFSACYISTDGATTFRSKATSPNIMDYSDDGSGTGGQAFYDLCVSVDTSHAGVLYVGGINVFKSIDSGAHWTISAHWVGLGAPVIHADVHVFAINPLNNRLYAGDDGGICYTANGGTSWNDISNGLEITEIYKMSQSSSRPDMMLIGCQDNGTAQLANNKWYSVLGGDGMTCAIDPNDTNYQYAEIYYGSIYQSKDAGQTFYGNIAGKGVGNITEAGEWVTPYQLSYANSKEMYAGYINLWKCSNLKAISPAWTQLSNNLAGTNSALIQAMDQSPMDSNTFYISRNDNTFFISSNVNVSSPTWTNLTSKLPNSNALVTAIRTHPKYSNVVYIIQNNDVYVSLNQGSTWTKITGTLPAVPKNVIAIDKNSLSGLYLGTDAGVYYRDSTMSDWIPFYTGLPVEPRILDLAIYYDPAKSANNFISAGSYGRGAWRSSLFSPINPVAAFTVNNDSQCLNSNDFVFTDSSSISSASLASWSWDFGDSNTSTKESPQHTYSAPGTYTVELIVTSSLGTTNNISKTVIVVPQATPAFTINAANQCFSGNSYTFTDQSTSSSGITSWSWNFGDGSDTSGSENTKHSYASAAIDTVSLTVTISNGCPATLSKAVAINPNPIVSFGVNDSGQCLRGNNFSFTDNSSVSSGKVFELIWDFGDGDSSSDQNPKYTYPGAGIYKVVLTAVSDSGCSDTSSQMITVYPQAAAAFAVNGANQCFSTNEFVFTDNTTISSGRITNWLWDFGDADSTDIPTPFYSYSSPGTYKVKLFLTSNHLCHDSISKVLTVYPSPKSAFSVQDTIECLKYNRFSFTNKSSVSPGTIVSSGWYFGDSSVSQVVNPYHSYLKSGIYNVSLVVTDSNNCTDSAAKTIHVNPRITAAFAVNDSAQCFESNNFKFIDSSTFPPTGSNTWAWTFGFNQKSALENPSHAYTVASTYNVILVVSNSDGCIDTAIKKVTVYPEIYPYLGVNSTRQCLAGNSFIFNDSSSTASGSIVSRSWNFKDGDTSTAQSLNYSFNKSGTFPVTLTVKSDNGCFDSISKTIIVNPTPTPRILGDTSVCSKGNDIYAVANDTGITYSWTVSGGRIISSSSKTDSLSVNWPSINSATVAIIETNTSGCKDSDLKIITIKSLPTAKFGGQNHNMVCLGSVLSFVDSSISAKKYFWRFGDTDTSSISSPSHSYANAGKYSTILKVTNNQECSDSTVRIVTVYPLPVAHWSADSLQNAKITFIAKDTSLIASAYSWDLGDGTKKTGHRLTHIFPNNKSYLIKLVVTDPNSCVNEFDSTLNVTVSGLKSVESFSKDLDLNIYPNPFHNSTNIEYTLNALSKVRIVLYDITGREIGPITDQQQTPGSYKIEVDANRLGLKPGTYLVKIYINDAFITKNIVKL